MSMSLSEAYACLHLAEGASRIEVERAFRQLKGVYAEGALATHSLLDAGERRAALTRLEQAYQQVLQAESERHAPASIAPSPEAAAQTAPGAELRSRREERGISLTEMAQRTKISPMNLEYLEQQRLERLPAPVYLKGFLVQYLTTLGFAESDPLVARYLALSRPPEARG